jgi:tetratricopeptide (TPR) repeat protein
MITRRFRQLRNAAFLPALIGSLGLLFLVWPARGAPGRSPQEQGESSSKRDSGPLPKETVRPTPEQDAERDIEVGDFYMRKGDRDAAIGRYQDAATAAPKLGKPRLLLAEAFEKKGDKTTAVKYYKEYLQVDPTAADKQRILKKIEKLSQ